MTYKGNIAVPIPIINKDLPILIKVEVSHDPSVTNVRLIATPLSSIAVLV